MENISNCVVRCHMDINFSKLIQFKFFGRLGTDVQWTVYYGEIDIGIGYNGHPKMIDKRHRW